MTVGGRGGGEGGLVEEKERGEGKGKGRGKEGDVRRTHEDH